MKRLLIIGPIAALAFTGCGGGSGSSIASSSPSGVQKDPVKLDDFNILPSTTSLKSGKVEFFVKNTGKTRHEFVVIDTSKPAAHLGDGTRVPEKGNVGETGDLKPGQSKTLVLDLRKGHYAVICNDPGHYEAGMHKDLTVS
jgi:uncharacterized cupredoxin-like copper-binding protein